MSRKNTLVIILATVVLSLALNILFGRYLAATVSTWPLLNRWKIVSPQAPIVMTSREVVRVSESGDMLRVVGDTKPKLSTLFLKGPASLQVAGGALNLTAEGLFITTRAVVGQAKPEDLLVKLNDGTTAQVMAITPDPATNLVIVRADVRNASVVTLGSSEKLQAGEKLVFLSSGTANYSANFVQTSVYSIQHEVFGKVFQSDFPDRTFGVQAAGELIPGQAIVNLEGQVVGIWDGKKVIASDVIRELAAGFISNSQQVRRPSFMFLYRTITAVEAKILSRPEGALVTGASDADVAVVASGPAGKAGIKEGDIITAVGGTKLDEENQLEELLARYRPGDKISLTVVRGTDTMNLELTAGELK